MYNLKLDFDQEAKQHLWLSYFVVYELSVSSFQLLHILRRCPKL